MLSNTHPADELSLIRAEMRRLRTREQELRDGFVSGDLPSIGSIARIEVRHQQRRVFQRDLLPPAVLRDDRYWTTRVSPVVTLTEREDHWVEEVDPDDIVVIEPF